jgi:hypothetical protein
MACSPHSPPPPPSQTRPHLSDMPSFLLTPSTSSRGVSPTAQPRRAPHHNTMTLSPTWLLPSPPPPAPLPALPNPQPPSHLSEMPSFLFTPSTSSRGVSPTAQPSSAPHSIRGRSRTRFRNALYTARPAAHTHRCTEPQVFEVFETIGRGGSTQVLASGMHCTRQDLHWKGTHRCTTEFLIVWPKKAGVSTYGARFKNALYTERPALAHTGA